MSKPTGSLLDRLGPEVIPFERQNRNYPARQRLVAKGEDISFVAQLINVTSVNVAGVKITTIDKLDFDSKYLWIINTYGAYIIQENTANIDAQRKVVCHSNMTAGAKALQGGELWFLDVDSIVINYSSGRYGAETTIQEAAVIEFWELLGFKVVVAE